MTAPPVDTRTDGPVSQAAMAGQPQSLPAAATANAATAPEARCLDCDAVLTGAYCASCGQHTKHHVHSATAMISEFVEDLLHADHRVWRTLKPLLFKPGFLTNEYLRGRRTRYLPPFRLYIILSLIFFLTASLSDQEVVVVDKSGQSHAINSANQGPGDTSNALDPGASMSDPCSPSALGAGLPESLRNHTRLASICRNVMMDNGKEFSRELAKHVPQMMFFFLPLIALFAKLLYLGSKRYYAEHLVFFVHFHACVFLLLTANTVAGRVLGWFGSGWPETLAGLASAAVAIYAPVYLYRAMRNVYGQGSLLTLTKFSLLLVGYAISLLIAFVAIATFTAMTLPSH